MCIDRQILKAFAVFLFAFSFCSNIVSAQHRVLPIEDFEAGVRNRLGGYQNTYQRAPSGVTAARLPEAHFGHRGTGLKLMAERTNSGYCGYWMHFFDMDAADREYLDATEYGFLSFHVKGEVGGESFTIKLADQQWIEKEDSVAFGTVEQYLPKGVTTRWQEVLVPLDTKWGLKLDRLGGLTLDFDTPGQATVFIDDVSLKSSRAAGRRKTDAPPAAHADMVVTNRFQRAVWLWSTDKMLDDAERAGDLFKFCNEQGVTQIWAQLPYSMRVFRKGGLVEDTKCTIQREPMLARFIEYAHDVGVEVHALAGCPEYAQRSYHHASLAIVDAVIAFNQQHSVAEQFDGIHFDNEPYLLLGWHDPRRREQILFEFLTLNAECQRRARGCSPRLQFGVDIPFWWQSVDTRTREAIGVVTFHGRRKSASLHLLEMLDNVGVMNYRDAAQGSDGLVAHGRDLLARGDVAARAKLFMGVETSLQSCSRILFVVGQPRPDFESALRGRACDLAMLSALDGHRWRVFDDGQNVHVGIEISGSDTIENRIEIAEMILKIATALGTGGADQQRELQGPFVQNLKRNKAWSDIRPCTVRDTTTGANHLLVSATEIVPDKITFADDGLKRFSSQIEIAERTFRRHTSYAGIAVHHYDSFSALVRGNPTVDTAVKLVPCAPIPDSSQQDTAVTLTNAK